MCDILIVNVDQDTQEKIHLCEVLNKDYVVLDRIPAEGLPPRSSTKMREYYD